MTAYEKRYEEIDFTATPAKWARTEDASGRRTYTVAESGASVTIRMPSGRVQEHTNCPTGFKVVVGNGDVQVIPPS